MTRTCALDGCDKPTVQRSPLCAMHRSRQTRNGSPHIRSTRIRETALPCTVEGCDNLRAGRGLCARHWQQWKRTGDPMTQTKPPSWTAREDEQLLSLDRYRHTDRVRRGELEHASILLGRSSSACRSRLWYLRKHREAA